MIKKVFIFALAAVMLVGAVFMTGCGGKKQENPESQSETKLVAWPTSTLAKQLPIPEKLGDTSILYDNYENFKIVLLEYETADYDDYREACEKKGFNIDPKNETTSYSVRYKAYNSEGYLLQLDYETNDKRLGVTVEGPKTNGKLRWPTSAIAKMLPTPTSTKGKTYWENSDGFVVYVGDTDISAFNSYVDQCLEAGFTVNYARDDESFWAENEVGCTVYITYEGFNTMSILVDSTFAEILPDETTKTTTAATETTTETEPETTTEANATPASGLRPEFKKAMDDYEDFIDDYVEFMEEYNANSSDIKLLAKCAEMMGKYADMSSSFAAWDNGELSTEEWNYYMEVMNRCNQKLYSAIQ